MMARDPDAGFAIVTPSKLRPRLVSHQFQGQLAQPLLIRTAQMPEWAQYQGVPQPLHPPQGGPPEPHQHRLKCARRPGPQTPQGLTRSARQRPRWGMLGCARSTASPLAMCADINKSGQTAEIATVTIIPRDDFHAFKIRVRGGTARDIKGERDAVHRQRCF